MNIWLTNLLYETWLICLIFPTLKVGHSFWRGAGGGGFPLVTFQPNKEDAATGQNQHTEISGKGMLKVVGLLWNKDNHCFETLKKKI